MEIANDAMIQTFTGKKIPLLAPTWEAINIIDIAQALSKQCRFNGHIPKFYSVAEHSVAVSRICTDWPREGLLHDGAEAYIGDMIRPLKHCGRMAQYQEIEEMWEQCIAAKFNLQYPWPTRVKEVDSMMPYVERAALKYWVSGNVFPISTYALPSLPDQAYQQFIARFRELYGADAAPETEEEFPF